MDTVIGFPSALYTATPTGSFIFGILNFTYQRLAAKCVLLWWLVCERVSGYRWLMSKWRQHILEISIVICKLASEAMSRLFYVFYKDLCW